LAGCFFIASKLWLVDRWLTSGIEDRRVVKDLQKGYEKSYEKELFRMINITIPPDGSQFEQSTKPAPLL